MNSVNIHTYENKFLVILSTIHKTSWLISKQNTFVLFCFCLFFRIMVKEQPATFFILDILVSTYKQLLRCECHSKSLIWILYKLMERLFLFSFGDGGQASSVKSDVSPRFKENTNVAKTCYLQEKGVPQVLKLDCPGCALVFIPVWDNLWNGLIKERLLTQIAFHCHFKRWDFNGLLN